MLPALNEAMTIADVIGRIPRDIEGVGSVEVEITYRGRPSKISEEGATCSGSGIAPSAPPAPEATDG